MTAPTVPDRLDDSTATRDRLVEVVVTDETDSLPALERWSALVQAVLGSEGVVGPAEANVAFVDVATMTDLNREHMGQDGPTDVLSFPIDGDDGDVGEPLRFIGDLIICPEVAATNAPDHAGTFDDELAVLLVHGTLHLLGHDHAEVADRTAMWAAERRLMAAHWRPLNTDPWAARS